MIKNNLLGSVSFFCPTFNEEENLEKVISSVVPILQEVCSNFEIIIVDNCSSDRTPQIADELAKNISEIKVIHLATNREYGGALQTGFRNAKNEVVVYIDSDNQYDFNDFKKMIPYILDFDVVTGYRVKRCDSNYRLFQSKVFNSIMNLLFGLKLLDINCSFKVYKKVVLDDIEICSISTFIDAEMLIRAKSKGYTIFEVPVQHFYRKAGRATGAKPHVIFLTIKEIVSYWFKFCILAGFDNLRKKLN